MLDTEAAHGLSDALFEIFGSDAVIVVKEAKSPTDEIQLRASIRGCEPLTQDQSFRMAQVALKHKALVKWELRSDV